MRAQRDMCAYKGHTRRQTNVGIYVDAKLQGCTQVCRHGETRAHRHTDTCTSALADTHVHLHPHACKYV